MRTKMWRDKYGLTLKQGNIIRELIKGFARKMIASNLDIPFNTIGSEFRPIYDVTLVEGHVALVKWGKARNY